MYCELLQRQEGKIGLRCLFQEHCPGTGRTEHVWRNIESSLFVCTARRDTGCLSAEVVRKVRFSMYDKVTVWQIEATSNRGLVTHPMRDVGGVLFFLGVGVIGGSRSGWSGVRW